MAAVTYDPQADALDISFAAARPSEGEEVYPGVILHFDAENRLVEIEILSASKIVTPGALDGLPLPGVVELHTIYHIKLQGDGHRMLVWFDDRTEPTNLVDLAPLLAQGGVFEPLRDPKVLQAVEVGPHGRTLVWHVGEDVIDLDADALWAMAQPLPTPAASFTGTGSLAVGSEPAPEDAKSRKNNRGGSSVA
jgi:uncharacterized protein YuzE